MAQQLHLGTKTMGEAISEFGIELYNLIVSNQPGNMNIFISPYSVSAALMLTMLGTKGSSESQLMSALKLIHVQSAHGEYQKLQELLNSTELASVTLSVANRLFSKFGLNIKPSYKSDSLKFYGSELELLDFVQKPEESRIHINKWVEEHTKDKIQDLIPFGTISPVTLIVLTNAIYFKGDWARKFDENMTMKDKYHLSNTESVDVDMMHFGMEKWRSGINDELKCKVLEMPYKGEELSMFVILPDEIEGLSDLEMKLSNETLKLLLSCIHTQHTIVSFPKFKMEASYRLQSLLPKLGILDIFDRKRADFSAMLEDSTQEKPYVSEVIHKAFIEVNEKGTEAAAATAVVMAPGSAVMPQVRPLVFTADHPFMFLIKESKSGTILFVGKYCKPPK